MPVKYTTLWMCVCVRECAARTCSVCVHCHNSWEKSLCVSGEHKRSRSFIHTYTLATRYYTQTHTQSEKTNKQDETAKLEEKKTISVDVK